MWLLINLAVPSGKQKQAAGPEISQVITEDPDAAPVMYKVHATLTEFNAMSIVVPAQVTASQVVGLLKQFKQARLNHSLGTMLPATSPDTNSGIKRSPTCISSQIRSTRRQRSSARWLEEPMLLATSILRRSHSKRPWNRCEDTTASTSTTPEQPRYRFDWICRRFRGPQQTIPPTFFEPRHRKRLARTASAIPRPCLDTP